MKYLPKPKSEYEEILIARKTKDAIETSVKMTPKKIDWNKGIISFYLLFTKYDLKQKCDNKDRKIDDFRMKEIEVNLEKEVR